MPVDAGIERPTGTQTDRRTIVDRKQTCIAVPLRYGFQYLGFVRRYGKIHIIEHNGICKACFISKPVAELTIIGTGYYEVGVLRFKIHVRVLKSMYEVIILPVTIRVVKAIKRIDGSDVYDEGISYKVWKISEI